MEANITPEALKVLNREIVKNGGEAMTQEQGNAFVAQVAKEEDHAMSYVKEAVHALMQGHDLSLDDALDLIETSLKQLRR